MKKYQQNGIIFLTLTDIKKKYYSTDILFLHQLTERVPVPDCKVTYR